MLSNDETEILLSVVLKELELMPKTSSCKEILELFLSHECAGGKLPHN